MSVRARLAALPDVVESPSGFSDSDAYWVDGREVAHFHGDGLLEIRLTRAGIAARRDQLRADPRVQLRRGTSDWLSVAIGTPGGADLALELAAEAVAVHRPPPGVTPKPPPEGADLARRKRFH